MMDEVVGHMTEKVVIPARRADRNRPAALHDNASGRIQCLRAGRRPGSGHGAGRRGLQRSRHRFDPRRTRLSRHDARRCRTSWSAGWWTRSREWRQHRACTKKTRSKVRTWWSSATASPPAWHNAPSRWRATGHEGWQVPPDHGWPFPEKQFAQSPARSRRWWCRNQSGPDGAGSGARRGRQSQCAAGRPRRRQRSPARKRFCRPSGGGAMSDAVCHNPRIQLSRFCGGPHAAHLVSGLRHRHHGELLHRALMESKIDLKNLAMVSRHRLHRPRRRLRESGFLPHHARPRHSLRHRPEAGEPEAERGGLQRRWRPVRNRRQSPDPCRAAQCGPQGHLRQQLHLCHDWRPDGADHAGRRHHLDQSLRHL